MHITCSQQFPLQEERVRNEDEFEDTDSYFGSESGNNIIISYFSSSIYIVLVVSINILAIIIIYLFLRVW